MMTRLGIKKMIILLVASLFLAGMHSPSTPPTGMVAIKGGCFTMGQSPAIGNTTDALTTTDAPAHSVCISDFFMDSHEVIQKDFEEAMGANPSKFINSANPVDSVTWADAQAYCEKLGKRLPTEAEWEYAARGKGLDRVYPGFDNIDDLGDHSWNYFNSDNKEPHPPGMKKPNELGLYDMAGNVFEWTSDWYSSDYYATSPKFDPRGPSKGKEKVIRGGSWCNDELEVFRTTHRSSSPPDATDDEIGIRCAMNASAK